MTGFVHVRFVTHGIGFESLHLKSLHLMNRAILKYLAMHYQSVKFLLTT